MTAYANTIAFEYIVQGARHPGDVAAGRGTLMGAVIGLPGRSSNNVRFVAAPDIPAAMQSYAGCTRMYRDAMFARVVERRHQFLHYPYGDLRTMCALVRRATGTSPIPSFDWAQPMPATTVLEATENVAMLLEEIHVGSAWQAVYCAGQQGIYQHIELPVIEPTCDMIMLGMRVDRTRLESIFDQTALIQARITLLATQLLGREVNFHNRGHLASFLFHELRLPVYECCSDGSPRLTIDVLERLRDRHTIVPHVIAWLREQHKEIACEQLFAQITEANRIHPWLDPLGTDTGRFSCRCPNLQGLHSDLLGVFVPDSADSFVEADFDQYELRILAELSQDQTMQGAFREGHDLHLITASRVLGRHSTSISSLEREQFGKRLNFEMIYGATPRGVANRLDVDVTYAQHLINQYFATFGRVAEWSESARSVTRSHGYSQTHFGRRRQITAIGPSADRMAISSVIQGTAADAMKLVILGLSSRFKMCMTIHDSILLAVPRGTVEAAKFEIQHAMSRLAEWPTLSLAVSIADGMTWGACRD